MQQHESRLRDLHVSDDSRLRDLNCSWDPIGGAKSGNIADIVTPSSLTIATMASIHGSDFEFFDAISDISANSNGRSCGD